MVNLIYLSIYVSYLHLIYLSKSDLSIYLRQL